MHSLPELTRRQELEDRFARLFACRDIAPAPAREEQGHGASGDEREELGAGFGRGGVAAGIAATVGVAVAAAGVAAAGVAQFQSLPPLESHQPPNESLPSFPRPWSSCRE